MPHAAIVKPYRWLAQYYDEIFASMRSPAGEAREVIEKRTYQAAVDADWEKSRRYGVTGVPTFVAGNSGVAGAQPYEVLEQLVKEARG